MYHLLIPGFGVHTAAYHELNVYRHACFQLFDQELRIWPNIFAQGNRRMKRVAST
jgi:hypothetical protein